MAEHTAEQKTPANSGPAAPVEKVSWFLMAAVFLLVLHYHLVTALLAGLLVFSLVHAGARKLSGNALSHHRAKVVTLGLIGLVLAGVTAAGVILLLAFLRGRLGSVPHLLDRMAVVIETAREKLGWGQWIPAAEVLRQSFSTGLREHARELEQAGSELGRLVVYALAGSVIGGLAAFEQRRPSRPLAAALAERLARLEDAFEKVVFAQVKISALNTSLTAIFLLVVLPLFGVHLPLRKTLVIITFLLGLIPVIGNLGSNAAIVVIALGVSVPAAIASLAYLVVIHKLEYFLNARIVGRQIRAAAWEILVAMLVLEAAFGIAGVVVAPILYAYLKGELTDRGLI
jgi:predicted PurR-regulated permease PerM